jgi:hypothetical protein
LTVDYLVEQEQTFDNSDDYNTEHFRYQTFRRYLNSKDKLSDTEFDNYLRLAFSDNDSLMAGSAAVDLFKMVGLTDFQFEKLCKTIGYFGGWTEKIVIGQTLLRQLKANKLTTELFKECLKNDDIAVHEYILDIADLNQLQELALNSKNKKIRNIASEKVIRLTRQQNRR